jgi:hypothetical protein
LVADRIVWYPRNYCKAKLDVELRGLKVMRSNYGLVASAVYCFGLDCSLCLPQVKSGHMVQSA